MSVAGAFAFLQPAPTHGLYELAVSAPDGSAVSVVPTSEPLTRAAYSPDGSTLVVSAALTDASTGRYGLFAVTGSGPVRRLTTPQFADVDVAYSRDGQALAFARNIHGSLDPASWAIFLSRPDGSGVRALGATRGGRAPTFSPDGSHLVYVQPDGLHVVFANGQGDRQITAGWAADPAWSPDGSRIAFVQYTSANHSHVVIRQPNGSLVSAQNTVGYAESPVWEPDGASLVYVSYLGYGRDARQSARVCQVAAAGGPPTTLFSYPHPIFTLAASYARSPAPLPTPAP